MITQDIKNINNGMIKKNVKRRTSIAALSLVIMLLTPWTVMAAPSVTKSNDLMYGTTKKTVMEKASLLTETYGVTSVQYALMDQGEIVVSGQTGKNDLKAKVPLTSDTIYGIGSTSKMFLTASVMKLVDEGKVNLDQPVTSFIPEFKMKDQRYKQITPRMLLNHSAGLLGTSSHNATLYGDNDTLSHDTFLDQLATQNLKAEPGAFSVYSNDAFTLAEILVERVSGLSFTAYIHKHFTEPLKMEHTKTPQDVINPANMAGIYSPLYKGQLPQENYNIIATGGIYSTAKDLVKFSQIFTGEVEGILSNKSVKAMEQKEYQRGMWPEESDSSISYGLGWDSVNLFPFSDYGIKAITKGGDTVSYHSSLVVLPEHNLAAAVTSSGGSSALDQLIASELLLSALETKGIIQERKPEKSFGLPVKADIPKEMSKYAGNYGGNNSVMKVDVNATGELLVTPQMVPNSPSDQYIYTSDGTFVNKEGTKKLKFVEESNGHVYLWSRSYLSVPGLGQLAFSEYMAQKLENNELPKDIQAAWDQRDGQRYYLMNEKYTSTAYLHASSIIPFDTVNVVPGYMINHKMVGADHAVNQLQIPGMAGRDARDIYFSRKNGVEYIHFTGYEYASEKIVQALYSGKQSKITIQPEGYNRWFSVPAAAEGKVMTVKMPVNGAFAVYDKTGICINHTVISGKNEVVLPENGRIVFAGEAGARFEVSLKK
ncbi:serine hydrolase domain-containing protein [Paenibacillus sp. RRE4]|uniref:serine hydrolase domain-containing protein n=1 Tax=Paenibacillus sp. RRE4 TaxID=2962587 RepID=UPI002880C691|nr:serine hydrolase domain-containing protein [Paenibacillus sp. RRE4]MDT0122759.1 serine hydrolase domain-containing protein [Paenibacillus sp. RRE4]